MQLHGDLERTERGVDKASHVDPFALENHDARVQPGQFEQGGEQPVHLRKQLLRFPQQRLASARVRLVRQQGEHQVQGCERGTELVGDVRQRIGKVRLLLLQRVVLLPEPQRHFRDLALQDRQLALVRSADEDPVGMVEHKVDLL